MQVLKDQSTAPEHAVEANSLVVNVIFTTVQDTLAALRQAAQLANDLHATIQLLVPHVIPYPLELNRPPVTQDFTNRTFRTLAEGNPVPTQVQVILCRTRETALAQVL